MLMRMRLRLWLKFCWGHEEMFPSVLARLLHIGSLLLFFSGVIFFCITIVGKYGGFRSEYHVVQRTRPLLWRTLQENLLPDELQNRTNPPDLNCRNSIQGNDLLVDERGFICRREHILPNGCCNVEVPDTKYYTCETCNETTHCCSVYEYCVSCCLHPSKRPLLEIVLNATSGQRYLFASVEDQFELCLFKCRTNSHSVEHENKYRDNQIKYCYGKTEPHESQREVTSSAVQ